MVFVFGGLVLSLIFTLTATGVTANLPLDLFGHIRFSCELIGEPQDACRAGALGTGLTLLAGLALVLGLAPVLLSAGRERDGQSAAGGPVDAGLRPLVTTAFVAFVVALLASHLVYRGMAGLQPTRYEVLRFEGNFISLENLAWPLLLQLLVYHRRAVDRVFFLALLMALAALSPFRGVLLAIGFFGILLPGLAYLAGSWRSGGWRGRWLPVLAGLGVLAVVLGGLYVESAQRERQSDSHVGRAPFADFMSSRFAGRLATPLYQSHMAESLARNETLPGVTAEILAKFRLSDAPTLNQTLFQRIFGAGTVGEATGLLYSEAVAETGGPPLVWIVAAPLFLILLYVAFRRFGYDIGMLVGIALWRGYQGGLANVSVALFLQIVAVLVLCRRAPVAAATAQTIPSTSAGQT